MQKYGTLEDGQLVTSSHYQEGHKPIVYKEVPEYNQATQYVTERPPVDKGDYILIDNEVRDLDINEEYDDE